MTLGITKNRQMDGVILGKVSAQIPDTTGAFSTRVSNQEVTMVIIAARSNHPMGMFGPGFKEVSDYFSRMSKELVDNAEHNGYLGQTEWLAAGERETSNQLMVATYFRTPEDVHNFAHGPLHRECWHWWNGIMKSHPHLSIMHELYHVPKGHWENIFINNHRTGIAATYAPVTLESDRPQWISTIVDASNGRMKTHTGRMGTSDGADNTEFENVQYSPVN